jgi:hypothetical protein
MNYHLVILLTVLCLAATGSRRMAVRRVGL